MSEPRGRSPKQANVRASTYRGNKGKKRERDDHGTEPVRRSRFSSQAYDERKSKSEIAEVAQKGGLVDSEGVAELIGLMQPNGIETKMDMSTRSLLAGVVASTDEPHCLNHFISLRGLAVYDEWLRDVRRIGDGRDGDDEAVEAFLSVLLRALEKLPVDLRALQACNIGKSVNRLRWHRNLDIQWKSRDIVDTWKKRVEAERDANQETGSARVSSSQEVAALEKSPHMGSSGDTVLEGPVAEGTNRELIFKNPIRVRSPVRGSGAAGPEEEDAPLMSSQQIPSPPLLLSDKAEVNHYNASPEENAESQQDDDLVSTEINATPSLPEDDTRGLMMLAIIASRELSRRTDLASPTASSADEEVSTENPTSGEQRETRNDDDGANNNTSAAIVAEVSSPTGGASGGGGFDLNSSPHEELSPSEEEFSDLNFTPNGPNSSSTTTVAPAEKGPFGWEGSAATASASRPFEPRRAREVTARPLNMPRFPLDFDVNVPYEEGLVVGGMISMDSTDARGKQIIGGTPSGGVRRDFQQVNGGAPSPRPLLPPPAAAGRLRLNDSGLGSLSPWFPAGNLSSEVGIPSYMLPNRGKHPVFLYQTPEDFGGSFSPSSSTAANFRPSGPFPSFPSAAASSAGAGVASSYGGASAGPRFLDAVGSRVPSLFLRPHGDSPPEGSGGGLSNNRGSGAGKRQGTGNRRRR